MRVHRVRVELFVKVASRVRVSREFDRADASVTRAIESGLAVRTADRGGEHAGFAASSGRDADALRWAADNADRSRGHSTAPMPGPSDVDVDRWDLDEAAELPEEGALAEALLERPDLAWIEAGTTIESLVGPDGWRAVRRRHRIWSLSGGSGATLQAQRGFENWEARLDQAPASPANSKIGTTTDRGALILTPRAAAPVVAALVKAFHSGGLGGRGAGPGWSVSDDPKRPDGLAGGSFDDCGFPARRRILAESGVWVGNLVGAGAFWRTSFRDPPEENPSNLVMDGNRAQDGPNGRRTVQKCRVVRSSSKFWVLELGLGTGRHDWIRVEPQKLLSACAYQMGEPVVSAEGPIVASLVFQGLD